MDLVSFKFKRSTPEWEDRRVSVSNLSPRLNCWLFLHSHLNRQHLGVGVVQSRLVVKRAGINKENGLDPKCLMLQLQ